MRPKAVVLWVLVFAALSRCALAQSDADARLIERGLEIVRPGAQTVETLDLPQALAALNVPSVSIALIDHDRIAWARAFGSAVTEHTLYQAASLSKTVTAVAVLRLAQNGRIGLDVNVDDYLVQWRIPPSDLTHSHPVTLRGLLSMTGGINVPGYPGYEPGTPLPSLIQTLDGTPPANSPAVRVLSVPGSEYAYSGGGYEIAQAVVEDVTHRSFGEAVSRLVLQPAGMTHSVFAQPLPAALAARAVTGHRTDGSELPGGWRIVPELAAGGMWSTPTDLAKLLLALAASYRGVGHSLVGETWARTMFTRQNGGPDGLGGAVSGSGRDLAFLKRGQNIGYQSYMLIFPMTGQGIVVMTNSDNGTVLATALIQRAARVYRWPPLHGLPD